MSRPELRGWFQVPAVRPARRTPATDALEAAAANVVGQTRHTWLSRTGAERYLARPDVAVRLADDRPATVELRPGELAAAVARHDAIADPGAPSTTGCGGTGPGCRRA